MQLLGLSSRFRVYQSSRFSCIGQEVVYRGHTLWICIHGDLVFLHLALHLGVQCQAPCSHLGAMNAYTTLDTLEVTGEYHLHHARGVVLASTWQRNVGVGNESLVTVLAANQTPYFRAWGSTSSTGSWNLGHFRKQINWTQGDYGDFLLKVNASHLNSFLICWIPLLPSMQSSTLLSSSYGPPTFPSQLLLHQHMHWTLKKESRVGSTFNTMHPSCQQQFSLPARHCAIHP